MKPLVPSSVPEGLLYLLTAFGPFAFGCVEPWSLATLEILCFLLALSCFLRGRREVPSAAAWVWVVAAAIAAFGALQALNPALPDFPRPAGPFTAAPEATRRAVLLWAAYAAVLWSVPQVVATHAAARRYFRVLFGLGAALAAQGLLQAATAGDKLYWLRETAAGANSFGPYYNRDHAANFLLMCLGAGIGAYVSKARSWPSVDGPPAEYVRSQGRLAAGAALVLAAVFACGSRGALLAMPLAGAFVWLAGAAFVKDEAVRRLRAGAALAFAAFTVYYTFRHVGAGAEAGALTDRAITERFFIYGDAWRWLRDAPLFGTGLGSFETVYPSYQDAALRGFAEHAHSDWLQIALETGALGLAAALAAAALCAWSAVRVWLAAGSQEMRALIGGALGATAAFAVHSLFEFSFQIPGNAVVFLGLVGVLLSAGQWKDKAAPAPRSAPPAALAACAAVACFLLASSAAAIRAPDGRGARRLAFERYESAVSGTSSSPDALRSALGSALAVAERRPYDYQSLALAGAALARLGRAEDARDFRERARLVRFSPIVVGAGRGDGGEQRRLDALKSLGLLPKRAEPR